MLAPYRQRTKYKQYRYAEDNRERLDDKPKQNFQRHFLKLIPRFFSLELPFPEQPPDVVLDSPADMGITDEPRFWIHEGSNSSNGSGTELE